MTVVPLHLHAEPSPCYGSPRREEHGSRVTDGARVSYSEEDEWLDERQDMGPQYPEPTDTDYCDMVGHTLCGEDEDGPRCYCGENRDFGELLHSELTDAREALLARVAA